MNVEVLSIGTELLLGEIVDTNSAYIARNLRDIGANLFYLTTVGDNVERITAAVRASLTRADVVITTGGLGPTVDDMTRQAVAAATGRELEFRPELLEEIAERFRQFGSQMSENNRVQAYIPAGSIPISNRLGTAPCFIVENTEGTVISLPGVPREMKDLMTEVVLPYLRDRMGGVGIIKARVLRTAGIGESNIDAQIGDLETWDNPTVGLAAHTGQTDIRITARADSEEEADELIAEAESIIRERLGDYIYGTDKMLLEDALHDLLRERGLSLAVSYSGPESERLTSRIAFDDVPVKVFTVPSVTSLLGYLQVPLPEEDDSLDFRSISKAEAERVHAMTGADLVIAIVTDDDGTGITAMVGGQQRHRRYAFGGVATEAPHWAGTWGMSMAWQLARSMSAT